MEFNKLKDGAIVSKTAEALKANNIESYIVENGVEALEKIKELIPSGASVMNGSSVTLEQVGFIDYLKSGTHGWNNIHLGIVNEKDSIKQAELRKQASLSDYYLGSVHALTQEGEFIVASNTGSQLPNIVFSSQNLIFVVSTKKIVSNLSEAMKRLDEHVIPLEDARIRKLYNIGTYPSKILIFKRENPMAGRKVVMILVNEDLGY